MITAGLLRFALCIFFLVSTGVGCQLLAASPTPTYEQGPRGKAGSPVVQAVTSTALHRVVGPDEAYTIALPEGWTVTTLAGSDALVATPSGQEWPTIAILPMLAVSDARYRLMLITCLHRWQTEPLAVDPLTDCVIPAVRAQLADARAPWPPDQAVQVVLQILAQGGVAFGTPRITPIAPQTVQVAVALRQGSQTLNAWGYLAMLYVTNPLLSQSANQPGISSFGFVTYCAAPPTQLADFLPICATVLRSFHPNPKWLVRAVQQALQAYQEEYQILVQFGEQVIQQYAELNQIISHWGSAMRQIQTQLYEQIQSEALHTGQNWIAALGQETNLQDPETGIVYVAPTGYSSYCATATGHVIASTGSLTPGQGPTDDPCVHVLQPW